MNYDRSKNKLSLSKNFRRSSLLKEIAKKKGVTMNEVAKSIKTRAKIKEAIVKASSKNKALLNVNLE